MAMSCTTPTNREPKFTAGGQDSVVITDQQSNSLLNKIIKELKQMNIHFSAVTDEEILADDIN